MFDFLTHMHHKKHRQTLDPYKRPWASDIKEEKKQVPVKRIKKVKVPAAGPEFLMPFTGYYCELCESFFGDQICAEQHIKCHSHNCAYKKYVDVNQSYEEKRQLDRQLSFSKVVGGIQRQTKHKVDDTSKEEDVSQPKEEKKEIIDPKENQDVDAGSEVLCQQNNTAEILPEPERCIHNEEQQSSQMETTPDSNLDSVAQKTLEGNAHQLAPWVAAQGNVDNTKTSVQVRENKVQIGKSKAIAIKLSRKAVLSQSIARRFSSLSARSKLIPVSPVPSMALTKPPTNMDDKPAPLDTFLSISSGAAAKPLPVLEVESRTGLALDPGIISKAFGGVEVFLKDPKKTEKAIEPPLDSMKAPVSPVDEKIQKLSPKVPILHKAIPPPYVQSWIQSRNIQAKIPQQPVQPPIIQPPPIEPLPYIPPPPIEPPPFPPLPVEPPYIVPPPPPPPPPVNLPQMPPSMNPKVPPPPIDPKIPPPPIDPKFPPPPIDPKIPPPPIDPKIPPPPIDPKIPPPPIDPKIPPPPIDRQIPPPHIDPNIPPPPIDPNIPPPPINCQIPPPPIEHQVSQLQFMNTNIPPPSMKANIPPPPFMKVNIPPPPFIKASIPPPPFITPNVPPPSAHYIQAQTLVGRCLPRKELNSDPKRFIGPRFPVKLHSHILIAQKNAAVSLQQQKAKTFAFPPHPSQSALPRPPFFIKKAFSKLDKPEFGQTGASAQNLYNIFYGGGAKDSSVQEKLQTDNTFVTEEDLSVCTSSECDDEVESDNLLGKAPPCFQTLSNVSSSLGALDRISEPEKVASLDIEDEDCLVACEDSGNDSD